MIQIVENYICIGVALILVIALSASCNIEDEDAQLFTAMHNQTIGVTFSNDLSYTEELNTYTYRNFYNGGGVGIGDFNNDGLKDVYLTGNLVRNHLYINKGDWKFQEVAEQAGVACKDIWSTGVSVVDINGDGWLDIYVSKSGPPGGPNRHNELFINNKDMTFSEQATIYGLADVGLSTHAAFFDMDRDGDLDCYLLNNSLSSVGGYDLIKNQRNKRDTLGGNKLYRNDDGHFTDVSEEAGIYGSKIGFGLGVTIGDVNGDDWPDIYVSNDYFEKDYLYINQKNGKFEERSSDFIIEMSLSSMGADMADLNNDGAPEIFVTDMLPREERRIKTKTTFDNWDKYQRQVDQGYGRQFTRNTLQLNNGDGTFSEISRMAGVFATDWSWGALIFDMNNDGHKDIFVANGLYKDLTDQDYTNFVGSPEQIRGLIKNGKEVIKTLIDSIPSEPIANSAFINNGNLQFEEQADQLGLGIPSFSNGASFVDLDNDGDLDLVINNVNSPVSFFKNNSTDLFRDNHFIDIHLIGSDKNTKALNSKVVIYTNNTKQYQELMPMRSYMSTTDDVLHFGLGTTSFVDSIAVIWPDGKEGKYYNLKVDTLYHFKKEESDTRIKNEVYDTANSIFKIREGLIHPTYVHVENQWSDFDRELLLMQMSSNEGPCICKGDVNNDDKEDFYIGGSKGYEGALYINSGNSFEKKTIKAFEQHAISEDTDCAFLDVNNDQYLDLYVGSGGNELPRSSSALSDRLYINNGQDFKYLKQELPTSYYESTSTVQKADFDSDGDEDLFVGIRQRTFQYGLPVNGYILTNNGDGSFTNTTESVAPQLLKIGMITDAVWSDIDGDADSDLIVVGEWMDLSVFINNNGTLTKKEDALSIRTGGLWRTIEAKDIDHDGDVDFVIGNKGKNSLFQASEDRPLRLYVNDFDGNGSIEQIITAYNNDREYPVVLQPELVKQIPSLKSKYLKHKQYAGQQIEQIFREELLSKSIRKEVVILTSVIARNNGDGIFEIEDLPIEAQLSSIYAIDIHDFDNDGQEEILYGGNQYRAKPQIGIDAASYMGLVKLGQNGTTQFVKSLSSGIKQKGEVRDMTTIICDGRRFVLVTKNNDNLVVYEY